MSNTTAWLPAAVTGFLQRHRKGLLSLTAAVALYALLGFFLLPWVIKSQLISTMAETYDAELRIEKVAVNPFVLSVRIDGLALDDPSGQPQLRFDQFFGNFQSSSLFRWAYTFRELRLTGFEAFAARDRNGDFNFDYLLAASEPPSPEPEDSGELIRMVVMDLNIQDSSLNWRDEMPVDAVDTTFGPVNVRVADLSTLPQETGQQAVVITTETQGTLSWEGDLQLNPLRSTAHAAIKGSHFPLASSYLRHETGLDIVDGLVDIELDYAIDTGADGQLTADVTNLNVSFSDVLIDSFSGSEGSPLDGELLRVPRLDLNNGSIRWPAQTAAFDALVIAEPVVSLRRDAEGRFNFESATKAGGKNEDTPAQNAESVPWDVRLGELRIESLALGLIDDSVTPTANIDIDNFNLSVTEISNADGALLPTSVTLNSGSGGRVAVEGSVIVLPELSYDLALDIDQVSLARAHPYIKPLADVNLDSGALSLAGTLQRNADDPMLLAADVQVADFVITETDLNTKLGSWDLLVLDKLRVSQAQNSIVISEVRFDGAYGDVLVSSDGSLNLGRIEKGQGEAEEASDATAAEYDGPLVRVGRVVLNDASADFTDESLPIAFTANIAELNGEMTTIATNSREPSVIDFEGKVDEYGLVQIDGSMTPFEPSNNTDITIRFQNVDMPKFTAYSIPLAGREIASGALDLDLGYAVIDSELAGDNKIVLRDFELGDEVPHPDAMSLPLGLAVALLKDPDGTIDIDLPVRGNVDDPEFSYGGLIWKALGNLVLKIVTSPFALLGNLVGAEADQLEFIYFLDGRADLTPPEQQKAAKIAEALALRPELLLSFPGVVDLEADTLALKEMQFEAIVEQRIAETANSRNEDQMYDERRRDVVETLFEEARPEADLNALQAEYVTMPESADERPGFDALAYSTRLSTELIALQTLTDEALPELARARAENVRTAIVAADASLEPRISITELQGVERKDDEAIPMKVTLEVD